MFESLGKTLEDADAVRTSHTTVNTKGFEAAEGSDIKNVEMEVLANASGRVVLSCKRFRLSFSVTTARVLGKKLLACADAAETMAEKEKARE